MSEPPRAIVLVGLMGTGKTTVGRVLAARLGMSLVDTDEVILERTGRTVREIFEADGEAAFRAIEAEVLLEALASPEPIVLAAAGGVVLDRGNRDALRASGAFVAWLCADPAVLVGRVVGQEHRPLLDDDPAGTFALIRAVREPLYVEVADVRVDVDTLRPGDVASAVFRAIAAEPDRADQHHDRSWFRRLVAVAADILSLP